MKTPYSNFADCVLNTRFYDNGLDCSPFFRDDPELRGLPPMWREKSFIGGLRKNSLRNHEKRQNGENLDS